MANKHGSLYPCWGASKRSSRTFQFGRLLHRGRNVAVNAPLANFTIAAAENSSMQPLGHRTSTPALLSEPGKILSSEEIVSETSSNKVARQHIIELDGVRGLAILMVFLFHYIALKEGGSFGCRIALSMVKSLWCGVDLFFVLSGFLITGILLDTKLRQRYFLNFFARRALRIFPLYFTVAILVFLVMPAVSSLLAAADQALLGNQGWVWFYAVNLKVAVDGFNPFLGHTVYLHHFWSLAVEEHFYLVWPFVVYFGSPRFLRYACMACMVGALALRIGLLLTTALPIASYTFTLCRVDTLAAGALLSLYLRGMAGRGAKLPIHWVVLAASVALGTLCLWRGGLTSDDLPVRTLGYTLLAVTFAGFIGMSLTLKEKNPLRGMLRVRALRIVGKYSYGLYIIHMTLFPIFRVVLTTENLQHMLHLPYGVAGMLRVAMVFAVCMILAMTSWAIIERYFLGLKRYF